VQINMAHKIDEIELDLNKEILMGWELKKPADSVLRYAARNLKGDIAPRVDIVKKGNVYQLVYGLNRGVTTIPDSYGGHRRSISHDISGHVLRCNLFDSHRDMKGVKDIIFSPIQEILLIGCNSQESVGYLEKFPKSVSSKFYKNYNRVSSRD